MAAIRSRPPPGGRAILLSTRSRSAAGCEDPGTHPPARAARHDHRLGRKPADAVPVEQGAERRRDQDTPGLLPDRLADRHPAAPVGVYAEEVLTVYAPFAMGVITNIGNG